MADAPQPGNKKVDPRVLVPAVALQAIVGFVTFRDIKKRGKEGVRGPRILWKLWGTTNTLGSLMYWLLGRRKIKPSTTTD